MIAHFSQLLVQRQSGIIVFVYKAIHQAIFRLELFHKLPQNLLSMAQPAVWLEYLKTSNASRVYVIVCAYSDLSDWISALCNYFIVLVDVIELMTIFIYAETAHRLARPCIFIYLVMLHVRHFFARLISAFHKASG